FSSTNLPPGATLNPTTGRFEWAVAYNQAGHYEVFITVTSGGQSVTRTAVFDVLNANGAPVFDPLAGWTITEGQDLTFRTFAFDPDHPTFTQSPVTYTATNLPPGATYDATTGEFHWVPTFTHVGTSTATF